MSMVGHDSTEKSIVSFISKITVCWHFTAAVLSVSTTCYEQVMSVTLALLSVVALCKGVADLASARQPAVAAVSPLLLLLSFVRKVRCSIFIVRPHRTSVCLPVSYDCQPCKIERNRSRCCLGADSCGRAHVIMCHGRISRSPTGRDTLGGHVPDTPCAVDASSLHDCLTQPIARSKGVTPQRCGLSLLLW